MEQNTTPASDNDAYHKDWTRIGKSGLDLIHQSPSHYYAKYLDPNREREKQTPALFMGSATHKAILEPDTFLQSYVVMDDTETCKEIGGKAPRSTNRYKEWTAEFEQANRGREVISADDFRLCLKLRDSVYANPTAALLLEKGIAEQRIDWVWNGDDENGNPIAVKCKSKPDWLSHNGFIVDIKTTEDASPNGFGKSSFNYRYHVQAPFYTDAYIHKFGERPRGFVFVAVEKRPPYAVAVYYTYDDLDNFGRREYEKDLRAYHKCLLTNEWPGYGTEPKPLVLPAWAYRQQ